RRRLKTPLAELRAVLRSLYPPNETTLIIVTSNDHTLRDSCDLELFSRWSGERASPFVYHLGVTLAEFKQ
ncbi:MAG: hypothetical protein O7C75_16010, partial [Verrucomicrobia bacterium]|nr:hypothetical protein [Verrucomicrobiota bacterium]